MKLILIGSHLCQDTLYALNKLKDYKVEIDFQDISSSFPALKLFLNKREHDQKYVPVKENGGIGIPFMIFEDGTETFTLDEALKKVSEH